MLNLAFDVNRFYPKTQLSWLAFDVNRFYPMTQLSWLARLDPDFDNNPAPSLERGVQLLLTARCGP